MFIDRKLGAGFAVIGIVGIMLGALVGGNLFTLITGEYGGVGPGFAVLNSVVKVDVTTVITTSHPENYVSFKLIPQIELTVWQWVGKMTPSSDGRWDIFWSRHAGVLTTDGKDWLEDQISDSPGATPAAYISLTRDAHVPAAADHKLWSEIDTGGGLDRTGGTYASTGVGTWTVIKVFTADATYTNVQATGLHWSDTDDSNSTMLCADTFAAASPILSDTLTLTWSLSVA
jgi:hypothetical protein